MNGKGRTFRPLLGVPKLATMCGKTQFTSFSNPFNEAYHPELDITPLCDTEMISKFKSLVGSANWVITLGRFDIAYAVSTLLRYMMTPREGHFKAMERLFGYLAKYSKGHIIIYRLLPVLWMQIMLEIRSHLIL